MRSKRTAVSTVLAIVLGLSVAGTTIASSSPAITTPESVVDNETVYVVAAADGTPRQTVVVDWLQVQGAGTFKLVDPAPEADTIESLTDGFKPQLTNGSVVATVEQEDNGNYFYRADTGAPLPLDITLTYSLDGVELPATDLAGKSGRLRIDLVLHNNLERTETITYEDADGHDRSAEVTYTVPLLCVPQFEIDGRKMTNIAPPEGAQIAIVGSKQTYAVPMLPNPDASATIEMDATRIALAPLVISAFPELPASADFSVQDQLLDMRDGLGKLEQLSKGHLEVVEGISEGMSAYDTSSVAKAADGFTQLEKALGQLASGADDLAKLSAGQYAYLDGVIKSINPADFDKVLEIPKAIGQMRQAAEQLDAGAKGLGTLLDGQITIASQLQTSNKSLEGVAGGLVSTYPGDTNIAALAVGLAQQQAVIDALLDGGDLGGGYVPGLRYTRQQLAGIESGLSALSDGLEQLEKESAALAAVPQAFEQIRSALIVLRDGGTVQGTQMPGLDTTTKGISQLAGGLSQAEAGLAGSSDQLDMLAEIPTMLGSLRSTLDALATGGTVRGMYLPGISTMIEGLGTVTDGLGTGVDDIRRGEALMDAMKRAADSYTTFLGSPDDAKGQLTFLFKIDGVSWE